MLKLILSKLKKKLTQNQFIKNVMILISGNVLGYAVNLVTLPLISRVYSPEQLGEYDLILSSGKFVLDAISLGLLIGILLPDEDKKAKQLCQLILVANVGFLTILFALFTSIQDIYKLFDTSIPYTLSLFLLAMYLLTYNMQNLFYSYTNRQKLYNILFWNPLLLSASNTIVSLILGVAGFGTAGYLLGTIFSYVICIIHMGRHVRPFNVRISLKQWKGRIVEYKDLTLVQMPANVISTIGNEIPTQYLGRVFGSAMLGGYSMAIKILGVPVAVFSVPVNRVIYQTMAEKVNKGENIGNFIFSILEKNIKIALLPIGMLIILGERIIPFILGESWVAAGEYITVLGVIYMLKFCSACISGTFVVMGRQKLSLCMSFINLAKFAICFGVSYAIHFTVFQTIIIYAVFECLYQLLNLTLCVLCTGYSIGKFANFILKYIVMGNVVIYACYSGLKLIGV